MPLEVPNLDDRKFIDLVEEGRSMVPRYAPDWTNHNPSDPGITLIELLAYVSEILIYRLNRITRESKLKFLQLLREVTASEMRDLEDPTTPIKDVDEALRRTVLDLQQPQRAVTCQDFENLARKLTARSFPEESAVRRLRCFDRLNLELSDTKSRMRDCPGHVSLVIVPDGKSEPDELEAILECLRERLEPMRLITTQLHVVKPCYLRLSLAAEIRPHPDADSDTLKIETVIKDLQKYFNPLAGGGPQGEGWPFGRTVFLSEVYALLEEVEGVDFVQDVRIMHLTEKGKLERGEQTALGIQIGIQAASTVGVNTRLGGDITAEFDRLRRDEAGKLIAVTLNPFELVSISVPESDFRIVNPAIHT